MAAEDFRYDGKRVLVVGGTTGMGAAAAQTVADLGAEVTVMDIREISGSEARFVPVDLSDRASVDAAADQVDHPVDAVFSCAGVADGTPNLMAVNFIAHRHLLERLIDAGAMAPRSSVTMISSVAGLGWEHHLERALDFLSTPDWDSALAWVDAHEGTDSYTFSKQAINAFVAHRAFHYRKQGIRLNAILPGPTDTPLAQANAELWLSFGVQYRDELGHGPMTPEQMGDALAFLGSDAASGIAGVSLLVDLGQVSSANAGSYPDPIVELLKTM